ncbi:MAG TPA: hypothetical protein VD846_14960 [Allosphingosinicella sp.]|nr:hypothetical protein [Allosphingosinicella sp.]
MSFKAGVQYGDFEGSAAADRADQDDLGDYLRKNGLMQPGEFLVAAEVWIGENHGGVVKNPFIRALVVNAPDYDGAVREVLNQDPVPVRKIDLPLSLNDFIGLFKRFAVTLTIRGGDLHGKDYKEV